MLSLQVSRDMNCIAAEPLISSSKNLVAEVFRQLPTSALTHQAGFAESKRMLASPGRGSLHLLPSLCQVHPLGLLTECVERERERKNME